MVGRVGIIDTAIKSVTGETEIMVIENNKVKQLQIGKWIDNLLKEDKTFIEYDDDRELLELDNDVYIPTSDLDGNVSWGKVTAVTRHNPSEQLYEIKTHGGRKVIVTDSHSLLIWNDEINKFERIEPTKINVGAYVPVTSKLSRTTNNK
jgi:intein/homing endonuclease